MSEPANCQRRPTAATKRYLVRIAAAMVIYIASLFAAETFIEDGGLSGAPAYILASIPGLSFAAVIWAFGALIVEEQDEFFRLLYVRQGLIATTIALTAAAVWGFLETYMPVEHIRAFWWPTLWCGGIAVGAVFNKVKYGTFGEIR
ncbi:hypothetical protein [Paraurantiacibacter namhicola]|uniref:Uncharacterized protein n=1 Tax=Paraurantiacibacter namhicola TaxID=645517 RepID=A0A1C7D616_9SPHN|nr:hypothetical protein [Paraurantiacibacter namhicola]ANU06900.1 hypothetical protein A6F65_00577 [Paraurantiacibacter namhicola]